MQDIVPTDHQSEKLTALMAMLDEHNVVAFRGLAGTGKSSMIYAIKALTYGDIATPTHKAANVLRQKGLDDVETIYRRCMQPLFDEEWEEAVNWLIIPRKSIPTLLDFELDDGTPAWEEATKLSAMAGPERAMAGIGISAGDHITGYQPKEYQGGTLIIDEASMVGGDALDTILAVYAKVILVGDHGQLPPVGDEPVLINAPGVELTEVHRQSKDSGIVALAYAVRNAMPLRSNGRDVVACRTASADVFVNSPVMVWRNATRVEVTRWIRKSLGYQEDKLMPGEPLICRSTFASDRERGLFNNSTWTVTKETDEFGYTTIKSDDGGTEIMVLAHMGEYKGEGRGARYDTGATAFRFGYALTVHTAQGSSWDEVYIHMKDYHAFRAMCSKKGINDANLWGYTSLTRAKKKVHLIGR